jgi:hypothetical protein
MEAAQHLIHPDIARAYIELVGDMRRECGGLEILARAICHALGLYVRERNQPSCVCEKEAI